MEIERSEHMLEILATEISDIHGDIEIWAYAWDPSYWDIRHTWRYRDLNKISQITRPDPLTNKNICDNLKLFLLFEPMLAFQGFGLVFSESECIFLIRSL